MAPSGRPAFRYPKTLRTISSWLLIAGFLLQPILTYLVTPLVAHDGEGRQVVVCTLKGEKLVTLDLPQLADNDDTEHCAALKLYQLASTAQVAEPPTVPAVLLYAVAWLQQGADHQYTPGHFSAYSTRAPPTV